MNSVASFLYHWWIDHPNAWHPIMGVYYLTYACSFRCQHCSDGSGTPYPQLKSSSLPASQVIELFRILRTKCDYLVITGGEPMQYPELADVLERTAPLRFRGMILTTNGHAIEPALPAIARTVDHLVFSLQTMDSARADAWYGDRPGAHHQILENIQRSAHVRRRKYEIIISSVVTPSNIDDLYGVYDYAKQNGFRLAPCPQLLGVKAHHELVGNPEYRKFYDFLIAEKKKGARIQGTVDYLEAMRDLRKFRCRPFTMITISPTGDVFYPCLEHGSVAGNLFAESNLHRLRQAGREKHGPQPDCGTQCHSACALGFSRLLENPISAVHEGYLMTKAALRNSF